MEKIIIFDFGSQYTQLIARRLRELNVYSEIHPYSKEIQLDDSIKGIVLSGSPCSVLDSTAPQFPLEKFIHKIPILAVCYGAQYVAHHYGGQVSKSESREYGRAHLEIKEEHKIFNGISNHSQVWMSHGDSISTLPESAQIIATSNDKTVAGFVIEHSDNPLIALQFHPEVSHTTEGKALLENFIGPHCCKCSCDWTPASFVESAVTDIRKTVGSNNVVLGISGGVDSSVAALLLHKAIGSQLHAIFVDNGLLRKNEFTEVLDSYKKIGLNVIGVNAADQFYAALDGLTDPEEKRKAIGRVFIEVFEHEAKSIDNVAFLAQGTIYPDVIESVSVLGPSVTIKSHHNVGGLPERLAFSLIEPLNRLFKDEVRKIGAELKLDPIILNRHPFPGPGLGIRILGEVNKQRVDLLQQADSIYINGLRSAGIYDEIWQAGAILLPVKSVGVMGDERTYENVVALRAVTSNDGMTADWYDFSSTFLREISNKIINQVKGINRVVYDISSKPPATIEWE